MKILLRSLVCLLLVLVLIVGGYVGYVMLDYSRIEDNLSLAVKGEATPALTVGKRYTALTYNIGFGAYSPAFSFFMDGGTESRAESAESVLTLVRGAAAKAAAEEADFYLFQEVDTNSDRSYHIDQVAMLREAFPAHASVFALNYHSAYLAYPLTEPHGASESGLLTLSRTTPTSAVRRSLPIATSLSKFLDLDRAYTVSRIPVEGGRELVLYNVHTSAYGSSPEIRTAQLTMLLTDMKREYDAGNYCLAGGDFNHDFTGDSTVLFNGEATDYGWAQPFPVELLPEGISRAIGYEGTPSPSCRNCDIPYSPDCMTLIVDGFLVSDNIEVTAVENLATGFAYSDHEPVKLTFALK